MRKLLTGAACLFMLASCSKDDKANVSESSLMGTYKITSVKDNGLEVFNNPDPSLNDYIECEKDDVIRLKANGVFEYEDVGMTCTTPPDFFTSTWSLSGTTQIIIDGDPGKIESFDGTTLVISDPVDPGYKTTFRKQ